MKRLIGMVAALISSIIGATMAWPAAAGELRIGGTGAVTDVLRALAPDFTAQTGIALVVMPSLGSSGANNAVADGQLGLAVSGRDLRDKEKTRGLRVVGLLRTPYGLVTSRPGPDGLASADIVGLYKSARPLWPDGMPMLIVLRPADDSDNDVLAALFPGMGDAIAQLRKRRDLSVAATDQDNADMAERMNGSLVGATLAQIKAEKRNLRFVALDGVMPSLEAYLDGSYRHGKLLYLVAPATPSAEAKAFVDFLAGPGARSRLRDLGLVVGAQ
jgi:phosphate transport system substrate-binding protein